MAKTSVARSKQSKKQSLTPVVDQDIDKTYPGLSKIDIVKALKLRLKNKLTYQEIADQFGVTKQAIQQRLQQFMGYINDPQAIQAYEDCKPEILSAVEQTYLQQMLDPTKLEKASINNIAYGFTQVHMANRLSRNQATTIQDDVDSIIQRIEQRLIDVTPRNTDK